VKTEDDGEKVKEKSGEGEETRKIKNIQEAGRPPDLAKPHRLGAPKV
jgi:hypothetical protein